MVSFDLSVLQMYSFEPGWYIAVDGDGVTGINKRIQNWRKEMLNDKFHAHEENDVKQTTVSNIINYIELHIIK